MCTIIPFSPREPPGDRLLARDKIEFCHWEFACDHPGVARMVLHEGRIGGELPEPDMVLIYAPGSVWARWGVARQGNRIVVWECAFGKDLGRFTSMRDALAALENYAGGLPVGEQEAISLRPTTLRRGA